jgi:hypothetical protein
MQSIKFPTYFEWAWAGHAAPEADKEHLDLDKEHISQKFKRRYCQIGVVGPIGT